MRPRREVPIRYPFNKPLDDDKKASASYEASLHEFEGDPRFAIKRIKVPVTEVYKGKKVDSPSEMALDYAQRRYIRPLELYKRFGIDQFIPATRFLIGHGKPTFKKGDPAVIYMVQDKVEGVVLEEQLDTIKQDLEQSLPSFREQIIRAMHEGLEKAELNYPHPELVGALDELVLRCLKMWDNTRKLSEEEIDGLNIIGIDYDKKRRKQKPGEGLMPGILDQPLTDLMLTGNSQEPLKLVDLGPIIATERDILTNTRQLMLPGLVGCPKVNNLANVTGINNFDEADIGKMMTVWNMTAEEKIEPLIAKMRKRALDILNASLPLRAHQYLEQLDLSWI